MRSTRKPIPAPVERSHPSGKRNSRLDLPAAVVFSLAFLVALATACTADSKAPDTTQSPQATTTPSISSGQMQASAPASDPPARDLVDLAQRYRGISPPATPSSPPQRSVGDTEQFFILNQGGRRVDTITAVLRLITPHGLFYFENGIDVNQTDLAAAAKDFEETVYPTAIAALGAPSPGPDGDPRVTILNLLSTGVGGYFTGQDQAPAVASARSNGRNIIYINGRTPRLGSASYSGVLAHELQHLLHWKQDHNEAAWVNEGMAELAIEWTTGRRNAVDAFLANPDLQLTTWALSGSTSPHYAAGYLFLRYLFQRLGLQDARALLAEQRDSADGVRSFLSRVKPEVSFESLFGDWAVANFLNLPSNERYGHGGLETRTLPVKAVAPGESGDGTVNQFGTDYLELKDWPGPATVQFEGSTSVRVLPADPQQGASFWWSGRGDGIDAMLTRELDLRSVSQATLRYWTWFSTEEGWDYGYVAVSTDGGRSWQALSGKQTTTNDPFSLAYGPGYTGNSGSGGPSWVEEQIDLSPYAGRQVLVRFEYVTDDVANGPGWAIDSLQVPEIGFTDDAESDVSGWEARGFQRVNGPLPQQFIVQLIEFGDEVRVQQVPLDSANRAEIAIPRLGAGANRAVIAISGATDGTTEQATYRFNATR